MFSRLKLVMLVLSSLIVTYGLLGGLTDRVSAKNEAYQNLTIFTEVLNRIRTEYVERPDMERAMNGAIHGMMEALDPYSSYVNWTVYEKLRGSQDMAASTGLTVSKRYGYAYVVAVHPGSPGDREGLRTGDLIESIDGQLTSEMSLWEARQRMFGDAGTKIRMRVVRARRSDPTWIETSPAPRATPDSWSPSPTAMPATWVPWKQSSLKSQ